MRSSLGKELISIQCLWYNRRGPSETRSNKKVVVRLLTSLLGDSIYYPCNFLLAINCGNTALQEAHVR